MAATVLGALIDLDATIARAEETNGMICATLGHDWVTRKEIPQIPQSVHRMCWNCGVIEWHVKANPS